MKDHARRIGELIEPILARCVRLARWQRCIADLAPSCQKSAIMAFREAGAIDDIETELLIQAHQLEDA